MNVRDGEYRDIGVPEPGQTWTCFGQMKEPISFSYDGVDHTNDLRSCHYTPLKGLLQFQENAADWSVFASGYAMALKVLESGVVRPE